MEPNSHQYQSSSPRRLYSSAVSIIADHYDMVGAFLGGLAANDESAVIFGDARTEVIVGGLAAVVAGIGINFFSGCRGNTWRLIRSLAAAGGGLEAASNFVYGNVIHSLAYMIPAFSVPVSELGYFVSKDLPKRDTAWLKPVKGFPYMLRFTMFCDGRQTDPISRVSSE